MDSVTFGHVFTLTGLIEYPADKLVNKQILKTGNGWVTLFAFAAGAQLKEHTAPGNVLVQVFEGAASVSLQGTELALTAGQSVMLPANIPHAVAATQPLKMLVTMVK